MAPDPLGSSALLVRTCCDKVSATIPAFVVDPQAEHKLDPPPFAVTPKDLEGHIFLQPCAARSAACGINVESLSFAN